MTTREQAEFITKLQVAQDEGKIIQFNNYPSVPTAWIDISKNNSRSILELALESGVESLRIKPESTLRPWKPEEVPVGCPIKNKGTTSVYLLTGAYCVTKNEIMTSGGHFTPAQLLVHYTVSYDHGKTWLPCGVME